MRSNQFFKDKVVVLTGASGGIGSAAAMAFSGLGARVVLVSRNIEKLEGLKEVILSRGGNVLVFKTDITSFGEIQKCISLTLAEWGKIDILICNAGVYLRTVDYMKDMELYRQSMDINFFGTLNSIYAVLPGMIKEGRGHIVILNSLDSKKGIKGDSPYVAAKSALDGLGDVLRQDLKVKGIKVTSVYPGRVDTAMIKDIKVPWITPKIPPEKVVKAIIRGIKRDKAILIVPSVYFLLGALNNLCPRFLDRAYKVLKIEGE